MEFLGNDNIDLLVEVCEDMNIPRNAMTNYAKIFYDNFQDPSSRNIMDLNKSFLLHMSKNISTLNTRDDKTDLTIPPETNNDDLEVLIQQKIKERDNELIEIRKKYNPEDQIDSVKLIKISDVLPDVNVLDDNSNSNVNENNKQKVSIGNTVVYNYNKYDPPEQLNVNENNNNEEIVSTLKSIIEHMNIIDKKLDDLFVSIQSFINT